MMEVVSETMPVARKQHDCMASEWVMNSYGDFKFTFSELRTIAKAKKNSFKIKPGQKYIRQFNRDCGDVWTYTAIPKMHQICIDHGIYDNC
jgi:hypothetical protein